MYLKRSIFGPGRGARWLAQLIVFVAAWDGGPAHAHVKWFAEFDLNKSPLPLTEVLTAQFVGLFLTSIIVMYAFFLLDRYAWRKPILERVLLRFVVSEQTAFLIMRGAACIFFAAVSVYGFMGNGFFLTPELKTDYRWVPFMQLGMAACALHPRTVPLVGLGIATLFVAAVAQYGMFHLLDYLILIGVAYFFLAAPIPRTGWVTSRYIVLYATTALSLLWGAVEKWAYPSWTYPLLERDPDLLMGFEPRTFMVLAGFVEFNLVYLVLSSASLLSRALALALGSIFALAIYKFGLIDAVGHLLIMAILFVLVTYGPTKGRNILVLEGKSLLTEAYFMLGNYVFWFVAVFFAYYGLHFLAYGN